MRLASGVEVNVVNVKSVGRYVLRLAFSDGHVSTVDLGPFLRNSLNPDTRKFLGTGHFAGYTVLHGNLVWGDYEMCFSLEDLYSGRIGYEKLVGQVPVVAESRGGYVTRGRKGRSAKRPLATSVPRSRRHTSRG